MSTTPTSQLNLPQEVGICVPTCIWEFDGSNWTVAQDNCDNEAGCACYDTSTAGTTTINARTQKPHVVITPRDGGKPKVEVSPEWFLAAARAMKADSRVARHPRAKILLAQPDPVSPKLSDKYETPCLKPEAKA